MMKKTINMKSRWGNYSTFSKEFKDEGHLSNWYNLMTSKGNKIITIAEIN